MVTPARTLFAASVTSAMALILATGAAQSIPQQSATAGSGQAINLSDIINVRSIDSLSLSPDGLRVAYRVISPSVSLNRVTVQWFTVSLTGKEAPVPLGGSQQPSFYPLFDMVADGVSRWTTASEDLLVLENEGSAIGIHRIGANGRDVAISHDLADIEDFSPDPSGKMLRYKVRADRAFIDGEQVREDAQGVHLDADVFADGMRLTRSFGIGTRMVSVRDSSEIYPVPAFAGPLKERTLDLPKGIEVQTDSAETESLAGINPFLQKYVLKGDLPVLRDGAGNRFSLQKVSDGTEDLPLADYRLTADFADGGRATCSAAECEGPPTALRQVLVDRLGHKAILLREEHGSGMATLYQWHPGRAPKRLNYGGPASLNGGSAASGGGCLMAGKLLVCVETAPTVPPRLVRINADTGRLDVLANPNVDLDCKTYPTTHPIHWIDGRGNRSSGILVLPPGQPARSLPLVLTTYGCRGFLRGSISMLTPEFLLAQRGVAALCVNHDPSIESVRDSDGKRAILGAHKADIEVYRAAIATLAADGVVDPTKVGISGHSYSAMIAAYAISHTALFSVASLGGGIYTDPVAFYVRAQLPQSEGRHAIAGTGLPPPDNDPQHLWQKTSAALNAANISAPVLFEPPENEWLGVLQLYSSLRDLDKPADMYVFPNAGHMLSRYPAQQYWRAKRSADWFAFWLTGRKYVDSQDPEEYTSWESMRATASRLAKAGH